MAQIERVIHVQRDHEEVFDALADFSRAEVWDPGVNSAEAIEDPKVGRDARFRLKLGFGPVSTPLVYRTTAYERPRRVVHEADNALVRGVDDITVEQDGTGARVTWRAEFRIKGPGGLADPLLAKGFENVADKAVDGLEQWLADGGVAEHLPGEAGTA